MGLLALAAALVVSTGAARADTCVPSIKKLAVDNQAKWSRYIFGLQSGPALRQLSNPNLGRDEARNLAVAVKDNTSSCRATAWALDRAYTGADKKTDDLTVRFDKDAFVASVRAAAQQKKNRVWHFNIPGALRVGKGGADDNLGHHWVVELTHGAKAPEVRILAAFEHKYTLADWLGKRGAAARAVGAGGAPMTVAQLEAWAADLQSLLAVLKNSIQRADGGAARIRAEADQNASVIFKKLFGVGWAEMQIAPGGVKSGADTVRVNYGQWDFTPASCRAFVDTLLRQRANTCNGNLCV